MTVIFLLLFAKATRSGSLLVNPNVPVFALLAVLSASAALACLKEKRWGYVYAAGLSLLVLLLYNIVIVIYLFNPTNFEFFVASLSGLSVLPLVVFFSVQSFRNSKVLTQKKYLATPFSAGGLLTVTVIGFLIGGSLVGLTSGSTVSNLLGSKAELAGAITIVKGASHSDNQQFYAPATITVVIGKNNTVTWFNADDTVHTVTSDQGLFDSGNFNTGTKWSYTFVQPGTYSYYCTVHPFMKGIVVVVKGS